MVGGPDVALEPDLNSNLENARGTEDSMVEEAGETRRGRVLLITENLTGGTGRSLSSIIGCWDPAAWEVLVVCHGPRSFDFPPSITVIDDQRRHALDRMPFVQMRRYRHLERIVRRFRPDVVHTCFFWALAYGRLLKTRGLIEILVENREDEGFNVAPWAYRILQRTTELPDAVICVSSSVASVVREREGVAEDRIRVIRNGIRIPSGSGDVEGDPGVRVELGVPPEAPLVGMVANPDRPVKGVGYFLEAIPQILREVPEARFVLVGGGTTIGELESRARALGLAERLFFVGFRDDVDRFYRAMDVSVLTSLSEGLSITLLESMSHGVPVVATEVGGNPELVNDGVTGYLVAPADPEVFAERVCGLLRDEGTRQEMGAAALAHVRGEFDLKAVGEKYLELYRSLSSSLRSRTPPVRTRSSQSEVSP